ncbi:MAG TPA: hypothetical protein VFP71_06040, partial [Candidatus Angelobacter sp.]|nr:hypothetical protein [Candidatus Angelobacter sp.]
SQMITSFASRFFANSFLSKLLAGICLSLALPLTISCGGSDCGVTGMVIGPASATVSHAAAAPANSQTFSATFQFKSQNGCIGTATSALIVSNWTASDPSVHLSASPSGQVTATCTAALANPVTITASQVSGGTFTGKASLVCQ